MVDTKKYAVFTYTSEEEIEGFLLSAMSYVYASMILQVFLIAIPAACVREPIDENQMEVKLKLDPDILAMHLDNFKVVVDSQALYEPLVISLQHFFFN